MARNHGPVPPIYCPTVCWIVKQSTYSVHGTATLSIACLRKHHFISLGKLCISSVDGPTNLLAAYLSCFFWIINKAASQKTNKAAFNDKNLT